MKKILSGLLLSTVLAAPALANAGPMPRAKAALPCPSNYVKWGGFKMGIQAGWAIGKASSKAVATNINDGVVNLSQKKNLAFSGVSGGFHAGYDFQFLRNWIVGLDTSIEFRDLETKANYVNAATGQSFKSEYKSKWTIALVPRIGYGLNDSLVYAGAGWVFAGSNFRGTGVIDGLTFKHIQTNKEAQGIRFAAGLAQRYNRILMGVEATYDMLDKNSKRRKKTVGNATEAFKTSVQPRILEAKIRLSYMM